MKIAIALCLLASLTLVATAQQPALTSSADTGLIQVSVLVTDPNERLVTGFEKEAFQLWEDGVEQKIMSMSQGKELNEYVLAYKPTNTVTDGSWRKLKVALDPRLPYSRLVVRAKQGYYAPTGDKN
jgi:hypothetical protein